MTTWTIVVVILYLRLLSIVRTAVIEKASVLESPKEYYNRIKEIPVDEITQEVDDVFYITPEKIQRILTDNPLLRRLSMFSSNTTRTRDSNESTQANGKPQNPPLSLKRPNYNPLDDNFDADYERLNETFFDNVDIKVEHEIRRQPTGRTLFDGELQPPNPAEYDDEQPFAVTESLVNSLERADHAFLTVKAETISGTAEGQDGDYGENQSSPLDSSAVASLTTQEIPVTTTDFSAENSISLAAVYNLTAERGQESSKPKKTSQTKKKSQNQHGLKKSLFKGMFFVPEEVIDEMDKKQIQRQIANTPTLEPKPTWSAQPYWEAHRGSSDSFGGTTAVKREQGGYVVSGTRYYFDNRIDGDVRAGTSDVMKEDYAAKENSREQIEMMQDPRFAVEVELSGLKMPKTVKYAQEGTKVYKKKHLYMAYEPDPVSTVSHTRRGDRLFERRITEIGGKKVTVELGNKHLHGVDLIVRPGSVVHGSLPSGEEKAVVDRVRLDKRAVSGILIPYTPIDRKSSNFGNSLENPLDSRESLLAQSEDALELPRSLSFDQQNFLWNTGVDTNLIEMCFFVRTDTQLTGKTPIMKYIGETEPDCILECVRDKRCSSVNYSGTMSTCEIFDEIDIDSMQIQYQLGYTFYMPKQTDVHSCLNDVMRMGKQFSPLESGPSIMCDGGSSCRTSAVLNVPLDDVHPPINYRLLPSKAACSQGSAVLFIRSAHSRDQKGKIVNTVSNISEDDCLFSCLTNKVADSHTVQCASAEYDENGGRCSLSSEPRTNELTKHESTTLYEKICVTESVSNQCSGAAVDRMANIVLVGYMHDTATTVSIEECIERCVRSEIMLGFQCLSIMYYYEETVLNCILNDASIRTNPESVTDVNSTVVDYFGIDDCYGLPEAIDDRQNFLRNPPPTVDNAIATEQEQRKAPEVKREIRLQYSSGTIRHQR